MPLHHDQSALAGARSVSVLMSRVAVILILRMCRVVVFAVMSVRLRHVLTLHACVCGFCAAQQAVDCCRGATEFARQHPEQYDPEFEEPFHGWV